MLQRCLGTDNPQKAAREDAYFMEQVSPKLLHLLGTLSPNDNDQDEWIKQAILETVDDLHKQCCDKMINREDQNKSGTTLATVFCFNNKAYIVGVGDSMVCRYDGKNLSEPEIPYHDIDNEAEKERIIEAKGRIVVKGGIKKVMSKKGDKDLAVARSIGPAADNFPGVIHIPVIKVLKINEGEQFLLASDGLTKQIEADGTTTTGLQLLLKENVHTQRLEEKAEKLLDDNREILREKDDIAMMVVAPTNGGLYGVCDGHGGHDSAYLVSQQFGHVFTQKLINILNLKLNTENKMENTDEILAKSMSYITNMKDVYKKLHLGRGGNTETIKTFVDACTELNDNQLNSSTKLNKIFELLEKEIVKKMGSKGNLDGFITLLNEEPTKHHQARLMCILYKNLKDTSGFDSNNKNMQLDKTY
jgi:serine/threonine protein phosphatase PrpC